MTRSLFARFASVLGLVGLLLAAGCAQDVGDIDRTQPDKIKKSVFKDSGEWYFQQTVVDTTPGGESGVKGVVTGRPYRGQRPVFTALQNRKMKRIKWEIHKDVLYARATVEPVEGLTEQVDGEDHKDLGIVAAFPIKSHFDVQRKYNPKTGEPTNVIRENKSDRPWYKREYMRVDWSTNLVSSLMSWGDGLGAMSPKAAANKKRATPQTNGRRNPYRTRISKDYVETVTEYVFDPDAYSCLTNFSGDSLWHCESTVAKVRSAFMKVPEKQDYEPMVYRDDVPIPTKKGGNKIMRSTSTDSQDAGNDNFVSTQCTGPVKSWVRRDNKREPRESCSEASFDVFERFGYFRTKAATWSEARHTYESGRKQYVNRWNIWETAYDDQGNRIPYSARTPEPVVYHLNVGYPKDLFQVAEWVEQAWDGALVEAAALGKYGEASKGARQKIREDLKQSGHDHGQMYVIKKNSCHPSKLVEWKKNHGGKRGADRRSPSAIFSEFAGQSGSGQQMVSALWDLPIKERKELCSELEWATANRGNEEARFTWQRLGDIRHSYFTYIRDFNIGWLGYGPASTDPKTGEIVSAAANFAGRLLGSYSNYGADLIQYMNGEISRKEIQRGSHVHQRMAKKGKTTGDDFRADRNRGNGSTGSTQQGLTPTSLDRAPIDRIEIGEQFESAPTGQTSVPKQFHTIYDRLGMSPSELKNVMDRSVAASAKADTPNTDAIKFLEQPKIKERRMSNPMFRRAVKSLAAERKNIGKLTSSSGKKSDGRSATDVIGSEAMHQAYLALNAPQLMEQRMERQQDLLQRHSVFSAQSGQKMVQNLALYTGVAKHFRGKDRQKIVDFLKKNIMFGTQIHEVGHTLGLRHNFSASLDALNYHDEFWEIQKAKLDCKKNAPECQDGELSAEEARSAGPELAEAIRDRKNIDYVNQAEFRLASVMDYTADFTGRFAGLGKWDKAAINFAYGRHIQMWKKDVPFNPDVANDLSRGFVHYTELPRLFGDKDVGPFGEPCKKNGELQEECVKRGIDRILNGRKWVSISEAIKHRRQVLKQNAKTIEKDVDNGVTNKPSDKLKTIRTIDYRFCSDEYEGRRLGCDTFDWGSNQVEVLKYAFEKFEFLQPFQRYRGYEIGASRYNSVISSYAQDLIGTISRADTPFRYFSFFDALFAKYGTSLKELSVGQLPSKYANLKRAAKLGLNFYAKLMTQPKPGRYCKYEGKLPPTFSVQGQSMDADGVYLPDDAFQAAGVPKANPETCKEDSIFLPQGEAQFFGYDYTDEYTFRINRAGTYIDKLLASSRMFEMGAQFYLARFLTDMRAFNISYWTVWPDKLYGFLKGTILGDYSQFGGGAKLTSSPQDADKAKFYPWQVVDLKESEFLDNTQQQKRPDNLKKVQNSISFDQRLNMMIYSLYQYSTWEDNEVDMSDYLAVWTTEKGKRALPEDLKPEAKATFVHPASNRKYVAIKANNGRSITYELVQWAKELNCKRKLAAGEAKPSEVSCSLAERFRDSDQAARAMRKDMETIAAKLDLIRDAYDAGTTVDEGGL
ncbi:MAG: zinc-dependent metalloprotease [Bradymonadaceae bacterium]